MPLPNTTPCGAKTKKGPCPNPAMANGRCRKHGGLTPKGIASPHWKGKGYSQYLPERMRENYSAAINDPALLELRNSIGLADARLVDLLSRVDTGESGTLWRKAKAAYYDLLEAFKGEDAKEINKALNSLSVCLQRGVDDYAAWDEVNKAIDQRRRLVESERKRLVEMKQTITAEQAMLLVTALLTTIHEHVKDRTTLAAIQQQFNRLTTAHDQRIIDAETVE